MIDVTGGPTQTHRTVIVRDGKIEEIGSSGGGSDGELQGLRVDGAGKFLIPGLWDMHVHMVFGDWFPRGKEVTLPLFIANGITGVRDMGGELEVLQQWRKEIAAGTLIGPRMVIIWADARRSAAALSQFDCDYDSRRWPSSRR